MSLLSALNLPTPKNFLPLGGGSLPPPTSPRAEAVKLRGAIESRRAQASELLMRLQKVLPLLTMKVANTAGDEKNKLEDQLALLAGSIDDAKSTLSRAEADLRVIDNPGSKAEELAAVIDRQGKAPKAGDIRAPEPEAAPGKAGESPPVEAGEPLEGVGSGWQAQGEPGSDSSQKSRQDPSGKRTAVFEVQWAEDGDQFYTRVFSAITRDSAFRGVPSDQFNAVSTAEPQTLMGLVRSFHQSYAMRHSDRKAGQKLKIQFSASYSKDSSSLTGKTMSLVDEAAVAKPKAPQPAVSGATAMLARHAANADRKGWAGLNFSVKSAGGVIGVTSMEKVGSEGARPKGAPELTEAAAVKELEHFMWAAAEYKGNWDGHFARDSKTGAMLFMKWSRGPDGPKAPPPPAPGRQLSKEEQFERATGVVYPQRINKTLRDVGAKALEEANPFSLQNLPYTIAGVLVPIGAMKLLTTDLSQVGIVIRIEWQLDRNLIQQTNAARTASKVPKAPLPARDLAPGDIIYMPKHGQQRVVSVTSDRIVTEPIKAPPPPPKNPDIKPIQGHTKEDVLGKKLPARKHVFEGDETGGYHSTARNPPTVQQLELLEKVRKSGTYKIRFQRVQNGKVVEFVKPDGTRSPTKDSTMFPDGMTEKAIMGEVNALMLKHRTAPLPPPNDKGLIVITGKSSKGFDITVWVAQKGDAQVLVTFFPKR